MADDNTFETPKSEEKRMVYGPYTQEELSAARLFRDLHPAVRAWLGEMNEHDVKRFWRHMKKLDDAETIWGFVKFLGWLFVGSFAAIVSSIQGWEWLKKWWMK
jgi:hypothetical protein